MTGTDSKTETIRKSADNSNEPPTEIAPEDCRPRGGLANAVHIAG